MKAQSGLKKLLIFVAAIGLTLRVHADAASTPAHAPGAIVGIVRNPDKAPVSGATVTAVRSDGGAIRATLSGSDGIYSFADLPPGTWSLTLQLDGYPEVTVPALQVVASKATRHDVVMSVPSVAVARPACGIAAPAIAAAPTPVAATPPRRRPLRRPQRRCPRRFRRPTPAPKSTRRPRGPRLATWAG